MQILLFGLVVYLVLQSHEVIITEYFKILLFVSFVELEVPISPISVDKLDTSLLTVVPVRRRSCRNIFWPYKNKFEIKQGFVKVMNLHKIPNCTKVLKTVSAYNSLLTFSSLQRERRYSSHSSENTSIQLQKRMLN